MTTKRTSSSAAGTLRTRRGPRTRTPVPPRPHEPELRRRVFVYGVFLRGEPNHHHLAHARFVGEARTRPEFSLYDLRHYPGLVPGGVHAVLGEVYAVDDATVATLDRLEGHPHVYRRTTVLLAGGEDVETYLLTEQQVAGRSVLPSGSWRDRNRR